MQSLQMAKSEVNIEKDLCVVQKFPQRKTTMENKTNFYTYYL